MCILCVIQKWARWVATLLPWLVIPLIGLWALSQLLPDELRFEITSPRLACVFVLLVTLFWYEILMPQLSAWRVRRYARLRERKRFEAIELEKLRKIATRRCRNCSTPYRDQNPGGGRFMCSYCGHSSKRPVLDLPVPPGMGISNSGIFKELVGKSGEILNGRVWSDKGLNCNQEWLQSGNLIGRSIVGKSTYWRKDDGGKLFRGDDNCLTGKSCSGGVTFACRLLTSFFFSIRWLWEKTFRVSSSVEDASSDMHRSMLSRRGDNGANCHESRGEKARRKAEEKRLARLEKELLEEEERKQREEVARLVEEQRRLRDEKSEARKDESKSLPAREKDVRKEVERKRHDRRKEKDKASSKRNSDAEEVEKRPNKESDQKRDFDKKSDTDQQEQQKSGLGSTKLQNMEPGPGTKNVSASNFVKGNTGNKYFDRMKGTILSSSRAFSGSGFFGKATTAPVNVTKENKFSSSADYIHSASHRRDTGAFDRSAGKTSLTMEDKKLSNVVSSESEVMMAPKRSWQQLFTRSTSTHSSSNPSVISRPNSKPQTAVQSPQSPVQSSSMQSFNNPINFGLPSPFNLTPYTNVSSSTGMGFSPPVEAVFPRAVHRPGTPEIIPEEPELFEDPCYVPDPLSLLGPVSESLDNFQLDVGASVAPDKRMERPHASKDLPTSPKGSKPSPIESPLSKLRNGENNSSSGWSKESSKNDNFHSKPLDDVNVNGKGTWQMWNSSLGQNGLSFIGGPENWLLPPEQSRAINNDIRQPSSGKTMASLFTKDGKLHSGMPSPQKNFLGKSQNGCIVNTVPVSSGNDPWMHNTFSPTLSGFDNRVPLKSWEKNVQNEGIYGSPISLPTDHPKHPYEHPSADCWSKNEFPVKELGDGVLKSSSATRPIGGGLFPSSDVQSLWSFD